MSALLKLFTGINVTFKVFFSIYSFYYYMGYFYFLKEYFGKNYQGFEINVSILCSIISYLFSYSFNVAKRFEKEQLFLFFFINFKIDC